MTTLDVAFPESELPELIKRPERIHGLASTLKATPESMALQFAAHRSAEPMPVLTLKDFPRQDIIREVVRPGKASFPEVKHLGGPMPELVKRRSGRSLTVPPVQFLALTTGAKLSFARNLPYVTTRDALVPHLSSAYSYVHNLFPWREELQRNVIEIDNLYLIHDHFGGNNFAHWLMDWAPRLAFLRYAAPIEKLRFVSPMPLSRAQIATFAKLKIDPSQIIRFHRDTMNEPQTFFSRSMFGCSTTGSGLTRPAQHASSWALDFVRELFIAKDVKPTKKLLIGRKGTRQLAFSSAVRGLLDSAGFQEVFLEDLSLEDQATLFNSAAWVVSAHGAALSNLIFCQPKTRVLEIFPPDYSTGNFFAIASARKLRYFSVSGERVEREGAGHKRDHDIGVSDPAPIKAFLQS